MPLDVHATEEEDKLVVLSSLNRLGGCTEEQLLRFLVENALMNQFQFYLALGGLKEAGFIREARHLEGTLLILTPQGRESVEMFASRIRASQTEKLNANAPAWKRRIRDELQMPAAWQETDNGFAVTLRALEGGAEIFSMTLTAATKAQAKRFCERWPSRAPFLYQTIMEQLGEAESEEKIRKACKETKKEDKKQKNGNVRRKRQKGRVKKRPTARARRTFFACMRNCAKLPCTSKAWRRQKTIERRIIMRKVRKKWDRI